ncbi:MAG: ATP-binding protein [Verrucomicrobiales bacterium]|nr:ATP-binding protein [Verrucomicrobiales bacterium]
MRGLTSCPLTPPQRRWWWSSIVAASCLLTHLLSLPTSAGEHGWRQRAWKTEQGLPHNAVECLHQSRDGYLWIGTREGLARFDGVEFAVHDGRTPGFTDDACIDLAEDGEGALWIATKRGVYRHHHGQFRSYGSDQGLHLPQVRQLDASNRDGAIWMAGPGGVARWQNGRFEGLPESMARRSDDSTPIPWPDAECLLLDRDETLWIGCSDGLYHLDPRQERTSLEWTDPDATLRPARSLVRCILRDRSGALWFGTDHRLIRRLRDKTTYFDFPKLNGDTRLRRLVEDRHGRLWIVCGGVLYQLSEGGLNRFDDLPELGSLFVSDVLIDAEDNLWIGTRFGGLRQLRAARLRVLTTADGLPHNSIRSVARAPSDRRLWIATAGGLAMMNESQVRPMSDPEHVLPSDLQLVFEDRARRLWVTDTAGSAGCFEWSANGFRQLPAGALAGGGRAALEDRLGRLWLGTAAGLKCAITNPALHLGAMIPDPAALSNWIEWWIFQSNETLLHQGAAVWTLTPTHWSYSGSFQTNLSPPSATLANQVAARAPLPSNAFLTDPDIRCLAEDSAGNLWWGTRSGSLHRRTNHAVEQVPGWDAPASGTIHTILADSGHPGSLWIGSENGLTLFEPGTLHRFTENHGLTEGPVYQIIADTHDHLWLATSRGLFRCAVADLRSLANGRLERIHGLLLNEAEGLLNANLGGTSQPGAALGADGRLWFATPQGLVVIDPQNVRRNERPPPIHIQELRSVAGSFSAATGDLRLAPGSGRRLEVSYSSLSYAAPERSRFRFRLDGHDSDWIDAGTRRVAYYTNLKPGRYVFRVIGCNEDGIWNTTGAALAFAITPHVHQTLWFAGSVGATLLALITWVHRLHLRAARAEERTAIARSMHDQLAGKLAALAKAAESGTTPDAPPPRALAELARSALRTLRQSISLNDPNADNLEGLVNQIIQIAEETLLPLDLRLRLDAPLDVPHRALPARFREQVVLIANEAINNIVKHAEASNVEIRLQFPDQALVLEISDDGRGIAEPRRQTPADGGLAHLRDRADRLGARLDILPRPTGGTSILLTVPFP